MRSQARFLPVLALAAITADAAGIMAADAAGIMAATTITGTTIADGAAGMSRHHHLLHPHRLRRQSTGGDAILRRTGNPRRFPVRSGFVI